jgi:hypothetical protein
MRSNRLPLASSKDPNFSLRLWGRFGAPSWSSFDALDHHNRTWPGHDLEGGPAAA